MAVDVVPGMAALRRTLLSHAGGGARRLQERLLAPMAVQAARSLAVRHGATEADVLTAVAALLCCRHARQSELLLHTAAGHPMVLQCPLGTSLAELLERLRAGPSPAIGNIHAGLHVRHVATGTMYGDSGVQSDLRIDFTTAATSVQVALTYLPDRLPEALALRFVDHLGQLLPPMDAQPDAPLDAHHCLAAAERDGIIATGRGVPRHYDAVPVTDLIARQAARCPEGIVVEDASLDLTYEALMASSERIAHHLRTLGLRPRSRVAVLMERSVRWFETLLGILRADMVYVPLSARNPPARHRHILADCGARWVVVDAVLKAQIPADVATHAIDPSALCSAVPAGDVSLPLLDQADDAYVMYTSGSTGTPKGVRITHAALSHYVQAAYEVFCGGRGRPRMLQFAEASFDASILELFLGPCHGGTCVIHVRAGAVSFDELATLIEHRRIDVVSPPTLVWHAWMERVAAGQARFPEGVKVAVIGGEAAQPDRFLPPAHAPDLRVFNAYGPTETTVDAIVNRCEAEDLRGRWLAPVGRPLPNAWILVLDEQLRPVPVGAIGELCIGGPGVSPGYIGHDAIAAQRFVALDLPGVPAGLRFYRSGDLGCLQDDGRFLCLGRSDTQVKVSGMRLDLSEIEACLRAHELVQDAAVTADPALPHDVVLTMHLVLRPDVARDEATLAQVRRDLRAQLPGPLVPPRHTVLDGLPVNASGKIDRAALAAMAVMEKPPPAATLATTAPIEAELLALWNRMMRHEPLASPDENFLAKHVSSLKLGLFFGEVAAHWDVDLDVHDFAELRTLAALARHVADRLPAERR